MANWIWKRELKHIHTKVVTITMVVISTIIITILNLKKDERLNLVDIVHAIANYTSKTRLPIKDEDEDLRIQI